MATNCSENSEKILQEFVCEICDYICFKSQHLKQHFLTKKHKMNNFNNVENSVNDTNNTKFICNCGKLYRDRSGLWKHKKLCYFIDKNDLEEKFVPPQITPKLIIELIKQNKELQQTLIDQNKTIMDLAQKTGNNNSNNNNNNNNKTFNLQVFLNETCKDAINLSDFVNQIQISINDLEETGKLGYAEGISKVFIKNLNDIDFSQRPLHCSDSKRETLYIKDENQWTKDSDDKAILTKAIKQVAHKNIKQISEWQKLNPEYSDPDSKQNDRYQKILFNSMSGSSKEESDKNYEKIARNIAKEVVIEK